MLYKKFKADYIFTGSEMLPGNYVLITDEKGMVNAVVQTKDAGDGIQAFTGIITPGLINCHCHLELSHLKGAIPNGTGLVNFLLQVLQLRGAKQADIFDAMRKAEQEMYSGGIVAVGDISNKADSLYIKQKSQLAWYNFIEVLGFTDAKAEEAIKPYQEVLKNFTQLQTSNLKFQTSLVPHAPYTIGSKTFSLINDLSENKTISIHNQECAAEDELYKTKSGDLFKLYDFLKIDAAFFQPSGKSSLQTYLPLLDKAKNILFIHNTCTTQEDIDFSNKQSADSKQQIFWCLCANANLYIEEKMPPVDLFRKNNCPIVLGTDSYSSNWTLSILDEMRRIQNESLFTISTEEILKWATINGAQALQINDTLGSFEKGKQPGVVLIDGLVNQNISAYSTAKRVL